MKAARLTKFRFVDKDSKKICSTLVLYSFIVYTPCLEFSCIFNHEKMNLFVYFVSECHELSPWLIVRVSSNKSLHLFCKSQSSPINFDWHFYSLQDRYINNVNTACLSFIEFRQSLFVDSLWRKISSSDISNVH